MAASPLRRRRCTGARRFFYENGRPKAPASGAMKAALPAADAHRAPNVPIAVPDLPGAREAARRHIGRAVVGIGTIGPIGAVRPVGTVPRPDLDGHAGPVPAMVVAPIIGLGLGRSR